jgi:hypothetical protein
LERTVGLSDLRAEMRIASSLVDDMPGGRGALGEESDIVVVETVKKPAQLVPTIGPGERVAVSPRRQGEAVGYPDTLRREHRIELPERRVLAAYRRDSFSLISPNQRT